MSRMNLQGSDRSAGGEDLSALDPPRAGSFIVTVYGDVVEPRGGVLWMGTLIDICGTVGLSETLVRTAVSRLVAAGRLAGERKGRRSYYRLTTAARSEFAEASRVLFRPGGGERDLVLLLPRDAEAAAELEGAGFLALGRGLMLGPDRDVGDRAAMRLPVDARHGGATLRAFAADAWDLARYSAAYESFTTRFDPLLDTLPALSPRDQLVARLQMVHAYRAVVLRDPHLPPACLPPDWAGSAAARLFARLYLRLSQQCDPFIAATFSSDDGALPAETEASRARLHMLQRYLSGSTADHSLSR
jgi:phenylacetic acid degradation operon negative regulatory protein